ncbi:hypothetical protein DFH06DRAFT_1191941 [Mycena polygramma]|nr:hypothetical protein DFH06DRAFT_1191941 [Mycena polygramma]
MAIDAYWGWDAEDGSMTLRRRTRYARDVGLRVRLPLPAPCPCVTQRLTDTVEQAPADVKVTHSSPVLCQPPRPARADAPFPIADANAAATVHEDADGGPAPLADVNTLAPERPDPTAPTYTLDRCDSEPDLSFDYSLSLDISLISDTSSDGDGSFTLPLPPAPRAPTCPGDSEFDISLEPSFDISLLSLISDTSASSADGSCDISFGPFTFSLPPPPPSYPSSPFALPSMSPSSGAALKPIGLGLKGLFNPSGAPFDGLGVLSFGVCGVSPSPCRTRNQGESHDGLSRTFLEETAWTWEKDPQHHLLGVIDEEPHALHLAQEQDSEHDTKAGSSKSSRTRIRHTPPNRTTTRASSTRGQGVERDTISSGLKRKPASVISGVRPHRVWRA